MGKRTSVYLSRAQQEEMASLKASPAEVFRAGLAALKRERAGPVLTPREAAKARAAGKPHGDPDHACSWACPESDLLADVRAVKADIGAGMTEAELHAKHYRPGPFSHGPEIPAFMDPLATPQEAQAAIDALAKPPLYPCCSHCTHPPTVSGHGRRCLQC